MAIIKAFDQVEAAFVKAAVDPSQWNKAMEVAAEATNSVGALMFPSTRPSSGIPLTPSMQGPYETYVRDGWYQRDERYRMLPVVRRRGVATDLDNFTAEDLTRPFKNG